jgi:hypothetical protein
MEHTAETVQKSNRNIVERGKIDTPSTQIMTAHFSDWVQELEKQLMG